MQLKLSLLNEPKKKSELKIAAKLTSEESNLHSQPENIFQLPSKLILDNITKALIVKSTENFQKNFEANEINHLSFMKNVLCKRAEVVSA